MRHDHRCFKNALFVKSFQDTNKVDSGKRS